MVGRPTGACCYSPGVGVSFVSVLTSFLLAEPGDRLHDVADALRTSLTVSRISLRTSFTTALTLLPTFGRLLSDFVT